jgi:hypothetical protein
MKAFVVLTERRRNNDNQDLRVSLDRYIEKNYILKKIVCPTTRPSLLKLGALGNDWGLTGK